MILWHQEMWAAINLLIVARDSSSIMLWMDLTFSANSVLFHCASTLLALLSSNDVTSGVSFLSSTAQHTSMTGCSLDTHSCSSLTIPQLSARSLTPTRCSSVKYFSSSDSWLLDSYAVHMAQYIHIATVMWPSIRWIRILTFKIPRMRIMAFIL